MRSQGPLLSKRPISTLSGDSAVQSALRKHTPGTPLSPLEHQQRVDAGHASKNSRWKRRTFIPVGGLIGARTGFKLANAWYKHNLSRAKVSEPPFDTNAINAQNLADLYVKGAKARADYTAWVKLKDLKRPFSRVAETDDRMNLSPVASRVRQLRSQRDARVNEVDAIKTKLAQNETDFHMSGAEERTARLRLHELTSGGDTELQYLLNARPARRVPRGGGVAVRHAEEGIRNIRPKKDMESFTQRLIGGRRPPKTVKVKYNPGAVWAREDHTVRLPSDLSPKEMKHIRGKLKSSIENELSSERVKIEQARPQFYVTALRDLTEQFRGEAVARALASRSKIIGAGVGIGAGLGALTGLIASKNRDKIPHGLPIVSKMLQNAGPDPDLLTKAGPNNETRDKRGRWIAGGVGSVGIGFGTILGASEANRRAKINHAKAYKQKLNGRKIFYRGFGGNAPENNGLGLRDDSRFGAPFITPKKSIATKYGRFIHRYAAAKDARMGNFENKDVRRISLLNSRYRHSNIYAGTEHALIMLRMDKEAIKRMVRDPNGSVTNLNWKMSPQAIKEAQGKGFAAIESPQSTRRDAYAVIDDKKFELIDRRKYYPYTKTPATAKFGNWSRSIVRAIPKILKKDASPNNETRDKHGRWTSGGKVYRGARSSEPTMESPRSLIWTTTNKKLARFYASKRTQKALAQHFKTEYKPEDNIVTSYKLDPKSNIIDASSPLGRKILQRAWRRKLIEGGLSVARARANAATAPETMAGMAFDSLSDYEGRLMRRIGVQGMAGPKYWMTPLMPSVKAIADPSVLTRIGKLILKKDASNDGIQTEEQLAEPTNQLQSIGLTAESALGERIARVFRQWKEGSESTLLNSTDGQLARDIQTGAMDALAPIKEAFELGAKVPVVLDEPSGEEKGAHVYVTFKGRNPLLEAYVEKYGATKIKGLTDEQINTVKAVLIEAAKSGASPDKMARAIRETIGLTHDQASAVLRYRQQLETLDPGVLSRELRDKRYDRSILSAIGRKENLPEALVNKIVDAYHRKYLAYRAMTIARTEGVSAANNGHLGTVQDILDQHPELEVVKTWVATLDNHTRPDHASLHGVSVRGFNTPFIPPSGDHIRWPGDPGAPARNVINCRCTISTKLVRKSSNE